MVTVVENSPTPPEPVSPSGSQAAGVGFGIGKALGGIALVLAVLIIGYFLISAQRATERRAANTDRAVGAVADSVAGAVDNVGDAAARVAR